MSEEKKRVPGKRVQTNARSGATDKSPPKKQGLSKNESKMSLLKLVTVGVLTRTDRRYGDPDDHGVEVISMEEEAPNSEVSAVEKDEFITVEDDEATPMAARREQRVFTCPDCKTSRNEKFDVCPQCGVFISSIVKARPSPESVREASRGRCPNQAKDPARSDRRQNMTDPERVIPSITCPKCGKANLPNERECQHCHVVMAKYSEMESRRLERENIQRAYREQREQDRQEALSAKRGRGVPESEKTWKDNKALIVLLIFFVTPLGIYGLMTAKTATSGQQILGGVLLIAWLFWVYFLIGFFGSLPA